MHGRRPCGRVEARLRGGPCQEPENRRQDLRLGESDSSENYANRELRCLSFPISSPTGSRLPATRSTIFCGNEGSLLRNSQIGWGKQSNASRTYFKAVRRSL